MTQGIDNYLSEFDKLPIVVQEIPTGRMLKKKMVDFRDAVPIILQLKDAVALRERHWHYLMNCTGRQFEWDTERSFALREIFDMELHRFKVGQGERSTNLLNIKIFLFAYPHRRR